MSTTSDPTPGDHATDPEQELAMAPTLPAPDMLVGSTAQPKPRWHEQNDETDPARSYDTPFERTAAPRQLGRYVVLDALGRGGMGVVLRAYDRELDRPVALKVLHREIDERHTQRLRREAQAMAKLSHPHVVQVYEVGQVEGQTFVAMELVKGKTVRAWIDQQPRPGWRACVELFVQLGAGLAAAHERGLVHRDFKPGNAIVDDEGRARVLDFGLARRDDRADDDAESSTTLEGARTDAHPAPPLETSLTATGAVLGTPAYMPPEQMRGREADARSDQFSFCASLYEAVYGQRPYEGDSMMALMVSMRSGSVRPAPRGSDVPVALRRLLVRGLSPEPADRWPSMDALLVDLRRLVAPKARRWVALSLAVSVVGLGGSWAFGQYVQVKDRCTGAEGRLLGVWDEGLAQEIEEAMLATGLSYAPGTWERVEQRLDEYARAWTTKHVEVCEATAVRGEQSPEVMDLRMTCLDERRLSMRAAVRVLADADATVVQNAVKLVAGLPGLSRCDDVEALRAALPPPEDPEVARAVEVLRERLGELEAEQNAGRFDSALENVEPVVRRAEVLGYAPLVAEAKVRQGRLRSESGHYDEAEQDCAKAYELAMEHRHDEVALEAVQELTYIVGYQQARHAEGRVWGRTAVGHASRSRDDVQLAGSLSNLGAVLFAQGEYEQAKLHHERALQIREQVLGPDHPNVAHSLNNLGTVLCIQGELEQAKLHHERALRIREQALGADHPDVAKSLNNLGNTFHARGEYEQAKRSYERALRIQENALGADHPYTAQSLSNLGNALLAQGEYEQAELRYERASRIQEQALGADHPDVAISLSNLGTALRAQGEYERAERHHERALRIREQALGADHPDVAISLDNLANVLHPRGEYEQAGRHHERALRIREQALGADHPDVALSLNNLGTMLAAQGRHEEAKLHHERALRIREQALGADHPTVAMSLNNLGTALAAQGQHEAAKRCYERALRIRERALGADHPEVAHSLVGLAEVALAEEDFATARTHAERAVSVREQAEGMPEALAEARFVLARALWSTLEQRPRARALAEQAHEVLTALEGPGDTGIDLAELDAWLAAHRLP